MKRDSKQNSRKKDYFSYTMEYTAKIKHIAVSVISARG